MRVPSDGSVGAKVGFFKYTSSNTSIDFNSVWISPEFGNLTVTGSAGLPWYDTGVKFQPDTWYDIKVHIDYTTGTMSAWINGALAVSGVPCEPKSSSSTFFVGTSWWSSGPTSTAYFDNVLIY